MIYNIKFSFIIIIAMSLLINCGQISSGSKSDIEDLLTKAKKNIFLAESIEDVKVKKNMLREALSQLNQADPMSKNNNNIIYNEVAAVYALYYFANADYQQANKYSTIAKSYKKDDPLVAILDIRIMLKDKGKSYANEAIPVLQKIIKESPDLPIANLLMGDSYLHLLNYSEAGKYYNKVLLKGGEFQVLAADRLEILDECEKTRSDPSKFKNRLIGQ